MKILKSLPMLIISVIVFSFMSGVCYAADSTEKIVSGPNLSAAPQNQQQTQSGSDTISSDAVKKLARGVEIYGKLAKPQAVFIIPGSDPKVDGLKIDRKFFDLIFRNVEKGVLEQNKLKSRTSKDYIQ
ncbi:MAG: hypothetical protein SCK70_07895, partial [bacterium]|nr:hypothetical protein [bacterium]